MRLKVARATEVASAIHDLEPFSTFFIPSLVFYVMTVAVVAEIMSLRSLVKVVNYLSASGEVLEKFTSLK